MSALPSKTVDYDDVKFEALAQPHEITVPDPKAAECWGSRPNGEILITNSKSSGGWQNQIVRTVQTAEALVTIQSAAGAFFLPRRDPWTCRLQVLRVLRLRQVRERAHVVLA